MQIEDQPKDSRSPGFSVAIAETICERPINVKPEGHLCRPKDAGQSHGIPLARQQSGISPLVCPRGECQAEDLGILEIADDSSRY